MGIIKGDTTSSDYSSYGFVGASFKRAIYIACRDSKMMPG